MTAIGLDGLLMVLDGIRAVVSMCHGREAEEAAWLRGTAVVRTWPDTWTEAQMVERAGPQVAKVALMVHLTGSCDEWEAVEGTVRRHFTWDQEAKRWLPRKP